MRWLSADTRLLEHRKWAENNMDCAIDCVYNKSLKIKELPALILQKNFMLSIFSNLYRKLPELKDYLDWHRPYSSLPTSDVPEDRCQMRAISSEQAYKEKTLIQLATVQSSC